MPRDVTGNLFLAKRDTKCHIKQVVNFYNRLENLNSAHTPSLVRHAFVDQRTNNFTWYKNLTALLHSAGHATQTLASPEGVRIQLQNYFDSLWDEK